MSAAYRNDQRQEYVNNLAYKHGTGLGTAPWYGVPGTAYDFGSSKSAGATYHTDASHPTGYGYQGSVSQYHSQPSYGTGYGKTAKEHVTAAKTAGPAGHCSCSNAERLDIPPPPPHASIHNGVKYPAPRLDKAGIPAGGYRASPPSVIGGAVDHGAGYGLARPIDSKGASYPHSAAGSKVGYDDMTVPAGYVSGRYESVGYGYLY